MFKSKFCQGKICFCLNWRILKGDILFVISLIFTKVIRNTNKFEWGIRRNPVVIISSAHCIKLKNTILIIQVNKLTANIGIKGNNGRCRSKTIKIKLLNNSVRTKNIFSAFLIRIAKKKLYFSLFLFILLNFLNN